MRYERLGATGLEVSRVCLGMMSFGSPNWQPWVLPGTEAEPFVRSAINLGINFFDTADFYSRGESEIALGAAIKALTDRRNVVIATKVGLPFHPGPNSGGLSRKHILASIDESLRRLQTDYVDLYQLHRADPNTPIEETLDALKSVVQAGKALHVGASNFATWQFSAMHLLGGFKFDLSFSAMQLQYNLSYREEEREMLPFCTTNRIGVVAYSPLARGWLTGNRLADANLSEREVLRAKGDAKAHALYGSDGDRRVLDRLREIAAQHGEAPARIALAWLHHKPSITSVLCGPLELSHLSDAVGALDFRLSADDTIRLEEVYQPQAVKDDAYDTVTSSETPKERQASTLLRANRVGER